MIGVGGVDGPERRRPSLKGARDRHSAEIMRLARFGVVGFSALGVYWLVSNALVWAGLPLLPASIVGYFASGFVSYFGHSRFSFRVSADHRTHGIRFLAVALLGLLIDVVLVQAGSAARAPAGLTTAFIGIAIPVINYLFNRLWVFGSGIDSF